MLKTALQTITWGDPQHQKFDEIFARAHAAGFDGVEIGFRRLGQVPVEDAKRLLDKHDLTLSASHAGGNLADLTQAANERAGLDQVLKYLGGIGCNYLIYSGLNQQDDDALEVEIAQLNDFADRAADHGLQLLYHNHDWEFRDDLRIWRRLREANTANLGFAPDLGWVVKGGYDIAPLLDDIGSAAKILHFKDFESWDPGQNTCHLGAGVIDFTPAWDWVAKLKTPSLWLTAEQDNAVDAHVAAEANGTYLAAKVAKLES